mmetsp:Transcript_35041/g.99324  ORF Transcript_35041/g.99324 Transcript_35041/m.99324 type:complete len:150 (-) Transcript_35041:166-615(-)
MACYHGCGTPANKGSWAAYVALLVLGFALLIALEINTRACLVDWTLCGGAAVANGARELVNRRPDQFQLENFTALCFDVVQAGAGPSPADQSQAQDMAACLSCTKAARDCLTVSGYLLGGTVTAFVGTLIPCMFFCCCSSGPSYSKMTE